MTLNVKLLVPKLIKLHYQKQCHKLMGITRMGVTINSLTIPCCSSEWWPELTKVLTACIVKLLTFIRLLPTLPDGPSCPLRIPGGKCSLGWKRLPRVETAASRGSYSSNRHSNWGESQSWGTSSVYLVRSQIAREVPCAAQDFPLFFRTEKQQNRNSASENPHKHPNYFYTLLNLRKYQQYVNI